MAVIEGAVLSTFLNQFVNFFGKRADALQAQIDKGITVIVKQDPNTFSSSELEKAKTTSKIFGNLKTNPQLTFENILEKESVVKEITIIPDSIFKTKGKLIITIDDSVVFKSKSFDAFEDILSDTIPINKTISQDSKVKIFMISSDGSEVGLTAQVTFGE